MCSTLNVEIAMFCLGLVCLTVFGFFASKKVNDKKFFRYIFAVFLFVVNDAIGALCETKVFYSCEFTNVIKEITSFFYFFFAFFCSFAWFDFAYDAHINVRMKVKNKFFVLSALPLFLSTLFLIYIFAKNLQGVKTNDYIDLKKYLFFIILFYFLFAIVRTVYVFIKQKNAKTKRSCILFLLFNILPITTFFIQLLNLNKMYLSMTFTSALMALYLFIGTQEYAYYEERRSIQEKKEISILKSFFHSFDSYQVVDFETGEYIDSYVENKIVEPFIKKMVACGTVQKAIKNVYIHYLPENQKDFVLSQLDFSTIQAKLEKENYFEISYVRRVNNTDHHIQLCFTLLDPSYGRKAFVILARNIDDLVQNEIEQQKKLADALALAQCASQAKTEFLSNMSHDIRTPMNAIVGFTALALAHIDEKERVKSYLNKITSSSNHLLNLINDVLDMNRIESGKITLDEKKENLAEIIHDMRTIIQSQAMGKQINFYLDIHDLRDEDVYCDKLRLNQIILNIFSNAVKYSDFGGNVYVKIIQNKSQKQGYGLYEFYIKDNGCGISSEFLERIFDPFEREEAHCTNKVQGTGLGLAIVKNILDLMGGTIEISSQVGEGSEFVVKIPLRIAESKNLNYDISYLKNCKVLVVDDDLRTCDSVTKMLSEIGIKSQWSQKGEEAVLTAIQAKNAGEPFCSYIIDWLMPDMNGLEVVRKLRAEVGDTLPVIILMAYDCDGIEEDAKLAGVTSICDKPLYVSKLKRVLSYSCAAKDKNEKIVPQVVDFTNKKVLLVEDNFINREIACEILSNMGFVVDQAEDGLQAVNKISNANPNDYDFVLMDIQMPNMDGYDATRTIRSLGNRELSTIPIVAMTANAFEEDRQKSISCGMNAHLSKPIDINAFTKTISEIIKVKNNSYLENNVLNKSFEKLFVSNSDDLYRNTKDGFLVYEAGDLEQILYANEKILLIWGCKTMQEFREFTSNSFKGMVHPDDLFRIETEISKNVAENNNQCDYLNYKIIKKDGTVGYVEDYGRLCCHDDLGQVFYVMISEK